MLSIITTIVKNARYSHLNRITDAGRRLTATKDLGRERRRTQVKQNAQTDGLHVCGRVDRNCPPLGDTLPEEQVGKRVL